jgi:hypothetical protein
MPFSSVDEFPLTKCIAAAAQLELAYYYHLPATKGCVQLEQHLRCRLLPAPVFLFSFSTMIFASLFGSLLFYPFRFMNLFD